MPASFQGLINSRIFKFTVGESVDGEPSEFFVHEDAVAQLSNPLHTLTKGPSADARAGHATWKDVSKDTFERFAQFAYTGDYSIPKTEYLNAVAKQGKIETSVPTPPPSEASHDIRHGSVSSISTIQPPDKPVTAVDSERREDLVNDKLNDDEGAILNYPSPLGKKSKKKRRPNKPATTDPEPESAKEPATVQDVPEPKPEKTDSVFVDPEQEAASSVIQEEARDDPLQLLTADFNTLPYPLLASRDNYDGTCEPATDFEKNRSYSKVFLSHASLYVLGGAQLVDSLKTLALFKLHKTLSAFELDNENIGDITDLARYAYSEDGKNVEEGSGGLRGLVCQYMGRHATELSDDTKFLNFLAEGGQVVKDFLKLKLQRKN